MKDYTIKKIETLSYLEAKQIYDVFEESVERNKDFKNKREIAMEEALLAKEMEHCDAYVAMEEDHTIIGFILVDEVRDKRRIIRLGVNKEFRKSNVLDDIMKYLLKDVDVNYACIEQDNEPLYNFLTSYGFRPVEKLQTNDYGQLIPTYRMQKDQ